METKDHCRRIEQEVRGISGDIQRYEAAKAKLEQRTGLTRLQVCHLAQKIAARAKYSTQSISATPVHVRELVVGDLVHVADVEVEVSGLAYKSVFGHGWQVQGREVVDGVVSEDAPRLYQTDNDVVTVWR